MKSLGTEMYIHKQNWGHYLTFKIRNKEAVRSGCKLDMLAYANIVLNIR